MAMVSIEEFEKALKALEEALALPKSDIVRDAAIQRFEFCVELSWKTSRKIMGTTTTSPKQVIREMAQNGLISDVDQWFAALEARILSSHTYDQELAEKVYHSAANFLSIAKNLLIQLKDKV